MIDIEQFKVFKKYEGQVSDWNDLPSEYAKAIISEGEWNLINELLEAIQYIRDGHADEQYNKEVEERLFETCTESVIVELF